MWSLREIIKCHVAGWQSHGDLSTGHDGDQPVVACDAVGALRPARPAGVGPPLPPRPTRAAQGPAQSGHQGCQPGCCVRRFVHHPTCVVCVPRSSRDRDARLVANDVPNWLTTRQFYVCHLAFLVLIFKGVQNCHVKFWHIFFHQRWWWE